MWLRRRRAGSIGRPFRPYWRIDKGEPDPVLLDPGDLAVAHDGGVVCHHQAKVLRHEGGLIHLDGAAFCRDVATRPTYPQSRLRDEAWLVDLGSRKPASLFHPHRPAAVRSADLTGKD